MMERGFEYPGNDLYTVNTTTAAGCCQVCMSDPRCLAWTWGTHAARAPARCSLKGDRPRAVLTKVRSPHCVSGHQPQGNRSVEVREQRPGRSLFCFSLVLPWGYEQRLLAFQYERGAGIFGCDEYCLFSNRTLQVAPGVTTGLVVSNLVVKMGGEFGTALNTDVFLAVWAKVISDDRFSFHDWSAKVDPDAVFMPARLRVIVASHRETKRGTYLNNCKFGLHGPLEVFSRNAVKTFGDGSAKCMAHFTKLCSGKCKWGEDMFIDQCMQKVLALGREDDFRLLVEDHCDPPPGWSACQDRDAAAFHPFKTREGYRHCLANATQ